MGSKYVVSKTVDADIQKAWDVFRELAATKYIRDYVWVDELTLKLIIPSYCDANISYFSGLWDALLTIHTNVDRTRLPMNLRA